MFSALKLLSVKEQFFPLIALTKDYSLLGKITNPSF